MYQCNLPLQELSPVYKIKLSEPFSAGPPIHQIFVQPILQTGIQEDGNVLESFDLYKKFSTLLQRTHDDKAEKDIRAICEQSLTYIDKDCSLPFEQIFSMQSAKKANLPLPDKNTIYTIGTDLIPSTTNFLNYQGSYDEIFASYAFTLNPSTLGVYIKNEQTFDRFKKWFIQSVNRPGIKNIFPEKTVNLIQSFSNLTFTDLTLSFWIRGSITQNNEAYSFAQLITSAIMEYTEKVQDETEFGLFPFSVRELIVPKSIVFINLSKHARLSEKTIYDHWKKVRAGLRIIPASVDPRSLKSVNEFADVIQKMKKEATDNIHDIQQGPAYCRSEDFSIRTAKQYRKTLLKILRKMKSRSVSSNIYKKEYRTFSRANRRNPDDYNRKGTGQRICYYPDIHLYIDTSGSISKEDYDFAMTQAIKIAKELNVDLIFNSFSTKISTENRFSTRSHSVESIKNKINQISTVTGGTDFEIVWDYILCDKKRQNELSIMITDFGWTAHHNRDHPSNLYYIPCAVDSWTEQWVENFVTSIRSYQIDQKIHRKIIY